MMQHVPHQDVRNTQNLPGYMKVVVVVLGLYVPPTAKVIRRRDLGLKSHPKDWRSPGSNSGPLDYKAGSLTARPRRLQIYEGTHLTLHRYLKIHSGEYR